MLPRPKRLSRATFGPAALGKRAVSAHFSVTVRASTHPQAAVVVSKKVAKRSVDRHLVKRRALAVLTPYVTGTKSYVVYARSGVVGLPFPELKAELSELLIRAAKV